MTGRTKINDDDGRLRKAFVSIVLCLMIVMASTERRQKYLGLFHPGGQLLRQCSCGASNGVWRRAAAASPITRIINGTGIAEHMYPWLALLLHKDQFFCSGSLISDLFVLTAAHCIQRQFLKDNLKVVLGQHDRCIPNSDTVQFSLAEIIVHGDFDPRDFRHDVALLRLNMRVTNNKIISPICLPNLDVYGRKVVDKYKRRSGKIVGWGSTIANDESSISCKPLQVSVPILERSFCIGNDASLFCAGYVNGTADSCQGDSGGPLQIINRFKRYEIIGIISSGRGCAEIGEPGLYTDVLQKLNWIYQRISDSSCLPYLPF